MKLCYHNVNNFGDKLNPWLWEQLLPGVFNEDESNAFVGIGTLLNNGLYERVPNARRIIVFGSGVGYGKSLPNVDESWKIYCLRGPLSAQALNLSTELAVTDAAILVKRLFKPTGRKLHRFAYMPHFTQSECGDQSWISICEQIGFKYIDARWSLEQVLTTISQTEVLLTEAMHGAILADALRVPWIPICTNNRILSFKWQDWCASIGVDYQPKEITLPFSWQDQLLSIGIKQKLKDPTDRNFLSNLPGKVGMRTAFRHWVKKKRIAAQLVKITQNSHPNLSDDSLSEQLTVQIEERLQRFKDDFAAGYFHP